MKQVKQIKRVFTSADKAGETDEPVNPLPDEQHF